MIKLLIGVLGIFLFVLALLVGSNFRKGEKLAIALDNKEEVFGMVGEVPLCTWEVTPPERVLAENKSQAVVIQVSNPNEAECESTISLRAPGFDMSPFKEEQKIALAPNQNGSFSWILTPRKTGTYEIAVSDALNTKIFGISVKNIFGLSSVQAKLFSGVGTIFGPMLTVPWWWDRLRKKKDKPESPKDEDKKRDDTI